MTPKKILLQDEIANSLRANGHHNGAEAVSRFTQNSVALLLDAHARLLQEAAWNKFLKKLGAWTSGAAPRLKETALSADLAKHAQELLENPDHAEIPQVCPGGVGLNMDLFRVACVVADEVSPTDNITGSDSPRTDVTFHPAWPEIKIRFSADAKVVESEADVAGKLFGVEGLGCYTRAEDPYETSGVVWLLAYAEDRYCAPAMAAIEKHVNGNAQFTAQRRDGYTVKEDVVASFDTVCAGIKPGPPAFCIASTLAFPVMRRSKTRSASKNSALLKKNSSHKKPV
ncbi:hypothetical protein [Paraburkholderia xenovorans]